MRSFILTIATFSFIGHTSAASLVEQYAETAAKAANTQYQKSPPTDGVTQSAKAYALGPVVVHESVLALRADVTEREMMAWRTGTRSEVVPAVCSHLKKDEFFNARGLQVRYRYLDRSGRVLDDFTVNKPACQGL